jgi:hypothetical protein
MPIAYSYTRFSSEKQSKGDSIRRQKDLVAQFIERNPELELELDTTLHLSDEGLSAYKGVAQTKGSLGVFIRLVEDGKIEKGSYLLVESLDRLSRQTPRQALNQLNTLADEGIVLVTLSDGKMYTKESLDGDGGMSLIFAIMLMARALGNRSILADPGKKDVVQEINEMIKKRDFWMPFALSILDRFEDQYIENTKNIQALYMANAFLTKAENYDRIRSGTHPYDRTVRPQIVTAETNYHFYELISEFANITGTGALLNTSLNLHGLPLVNDHFQALYVFRHSGLKYLVIDDLLITK